MSSLSCWSVLIATSPNCTCRRIIKGKENQAYPLCRWMVSSDEQNQRCRCRAKRRRNRPQDFSLKDRSTPPISGYGTQPTFSGPGRFLSILQRILKGDVIPVHLVF